MGLLVKLLYIQKIPAYFYVLTIDVIVRGNKCYVTNAGAFIKCKLRSKPGNITVNKI